MRQFASVAGGPSVIAVLGLVLTAPLLVSGAPLTHSAWYNLNWSIQFAREMGSGILYPRWLPDAFDGLGSPAFVFYAPLPFFLTAPFLLVAPEGADPNRLVGAVQALLVVGSGFSMRVWLRRQAGETAATLGGAMYMAAPYHMTDLYLRGSFGEILCYALLPALIRALTDLLSGLAGAWRRFALCVALLLLAHLPTALLAGVFLIPAVILRAAASGPDRGRRIMLALSAGAFGMILASAYVVPALTLLEAANTDYHLDGHYEASRWLLAAPEAWASRALMTLIATCAAALAAVGLAAVLLGLRQAGRSGAVFWGAFTLFLLVVMSGILPFLWADPSPLARVEFPWRMLLLVEFTAVTAFALALPQRVAPAGLAVLCVGLVALPALVVAAGAAQRRTQFDEASRHVRDRVLALRVDPLEYLPRGHWLRYAPGGGMSLAGIERLVAPYADRVFAWTDPAGRARILASPMPGHGMRLQIEAAAGTRIILRRFHFPAWVLVHADGRPGPALAPHGPDRLSSFVVDAGTADLRLIWSAPAPLRFAGWVSFLAWVAMLVSWPLTWLRRPHVRG